MAMNSLLLAQILFLHLGTVLDKEVKKGGKVSGLIYRITLQVESTFPFCEKTISLLSILDMWIFFFILSLEGNGTPLQYSCLEDPMDRGAW